MKRLKKTLSLDNNEESDNQAINSGFDLVFNFQSDSPVKQYRSMLDSLKEKPNRNEIQLLKMLNAQKKLKGQANQRQNDRTYTQYCQIMNYASLNKNAFKFKQKTIQLNFINSQKLRSQSKGGQKHQRNLTEVMQNKKIQYINLDNMLHQQKIKVQNMLGNHKTRKEVLEKAILFERLYHIQQTEKPQKKNSKLPQRFCGVNPKHLRVPQDNLTEKGYQRRKIVYGLRKFHFYHHANKLQKSFINKKKNANLDVINIILQSAKQEAYQSSKKLSNSQDSAKKLFLKYSNSDVQNPEQMYKLMTVDDLKQFFKDFALDFQNIDEIKDRLNQDSDISYFQFYEILYLLALNKNKSQPEQVAQFYVAGFVAQLKLKFPNQYYPPLWLKLRNDSNLIIKVANTLDLKQIVSNIYTKFLMKMGKSSQRSLMTFTDLLQLFWDIKLYPKQIGKRSLRFYYLYAKSQEGGLTSQNLQQLLIAISIQHSQTKNQIANSIKDLSLLLQMCALARNK